MPAASSRASVSTLCISHEPAVETPRAEDQDGHDQRAGVPSSPAHLCRTLATTDVLRPVVLVLKQRDWDGLVRTFGVSSGVSSRTVAQLSKTVGSGLLDGATGVLCTRLRRELALCYVCRASAVAESE